MGSAEAERQEAEMTGPLRFYPTNRTSTLSDVELRKAGYLLENLRESSGVDFDELLSTLVSYAT